MKMALDTHILIYWCVEPERLTAAQQHAIRTIHRDNPAIVADISLWEISALKSAGRIQIDMPRLQWLNKATAPPLVTSCGDYRQYCGRGRANRRLGKPGSG